MNAHLLVVEDESEIRALIREGLGRRGYRITEAGSGDDFLRRFPSADFDLILLDLNLPDIDGLTLLREVRNRSRAPIFVVSGRSDESSRVRALELGADDFVLKPFSLRELELRITNFLQRQLERVRGEAAMPNGWQFGDWTVNCPRRSIMVSDGRSPELTRGEFDVLVCLLRAAGRAVPREEIIDFVEANGSRMSQESLTTVVYRLRRKLASASGRSSPNITTLHGIGFRMDDSVTAISLDDATI